MTTAWVLTEVADGLAETDGRALVPHLVQDLEADDGVTIIHGDEALWRRGMRLYGERQDKAWSLTDCISFIVMGDR